MIWAAGSAEDLLNWLVLSSTTLCSTALSACALWALNRALAQGFFLSGSSLSTLGARGRFFDFVSLTTAGRASLPLAAGLNLLGGASCESRRVTVCTTPSSPVVSTLWLLAAKVILPSVQAACRLAARPDCSRSLVALSALTCSAACLASASTRRLARQSAVVIFLPSDPCLCPIA